MPLPLPPGGVIESVPPPLIDTPRRLKEFIAVTLPPPAKEIFFRANQDQELFAALLTAAIAEVPLKGVLPINPTKFEEVVPVMLIALVNVTVLLPKANDTLFGAAILSVVIVGVM